MEPPSKAIGINTSANTSSLRQDISSANNPGSLSSRAHAISVPDPNVPLWEILNDQYHPEENPNGYVSVGIAENRLMHGEIQQHVSSNFGTLPQSAFTYGDGPVGTKRLRKAVARSLNRWFEPVREVTYDQVIVTNGVSHAIEHVVWCFAQPGQGVLLGRPYYVSFIPDISLRPAAEVVKVGFGKDVDPMGMQAVEAYERALLDAKKRGVVVKALMFCSPHNPLGRCYEKEVMVEYLKLCQKYQIHFISDEIYALSVWENKEDAEPKQVPFTSVLQIELEGVIDSNLVHVLWGMSKDFGANGMRVGCIISQSNKPLLSSLQALGLYSYASQAVEHIAANLLEDEPWVDNYIKTNQERLSETYSFVVKFLRQHNITYAPGANAAFFLWMDLGKKYLELHPDRASADQEDITTEVFNLLLKHRVYIGSGIAFGAEQPGLFRIVFSHPREYLEEGLERMLKALNDVAT